MKREVFAFILFSVIFIAACTQLEVENEIKKPVNSKIEIESPDCCIGCGVNECERAACPYECCDEEDPYDLSECNDGLICNNNECLTEEEISALKEDSSAPTTRVFVLPDEITPGEYVEVVVVPGNEGYERRMNFYTEKGLKMGSYNIRCGKVIYECFVKVRQRYKTSDFWEPGKYYVEITDIETNEPVRFFFDVLKE